LDYLSKRYKKASTMISRKIEDEVILVPIRQSVGDLQNIYTLNEVGAFIWEYLEGENHGHKIKDMIVKEFDVTEEKAKKDLTHFLKQLLEIKAIKPDGAMEVSK